MRFRRKKYLERDRLVVGHNAESGGVRVDRVQDLREDRGDAKVSGL